MTTAPSRFPGYVRAGGATQAEESTVQQRKSRKREKEDVERRCGRLEADMAVRKRTVSGMVESPRRGLDSPRDRKASKGAAAVKRQQRQMAGRADCR